MYRYANKLNSGECRNVWKHEAFCLNDFYYIIETFIQLGKYKVERDGKWMAHGECETKKENRSLTYIKTTIVIYIRVYVVLWYSEILILQKMFLLKCECERMNEHLFLCHTPIFPPFRINSCVWCTYFSVCVCVFSTIAFVFIHFNFDCQSIFSRLEKTNPEIFYADAYMECSSGTVVLTVSELSDENST